jgi:hypothetical protein
MKTLINDVPVLLISVYGPNTNEKTTFFQDLGNILAENLESYVICAGDWNLTYCTDPSAENIDIINMNAPPSIYRSRMLAKICEEHNLMDPYRLLHHKARDFTFVPRAGTKNRSRLDFFLVSESLLTICNKCTISSSLDTILFDHKSIKLSFGTSAKCTKHFINPCIFSHPRFKPIVATAAVETYLQHAVRGQDGLDLEAGLQHVASVIRLITQANDLEFDIAFEGSTDLKVLTLAGIQAEINLSVEDYPDPDLLNDIELSCTDDVFLEVMMGNIRNVLISFQAWLNKAKGARVTALNRQLHELKFNFADNFEEIFRLEAALCSIKEEELSSKIEEIKLFDNLHNEKPSPLFLTLIKRRNNDSLSGIKAENGRVFASDTEREEHIVRHFEKIYVRKKDAAKVDYENCIKNFLGEEICSNPVVTGSKLTEAEKNTLEGPLTLVELDLSLKNANCKSAPGLDGFSNKLIKLCWEYLRRPLLNYANHCFISGSMTHNFRSACIRLIPKKGDLSNINNWRPISLLSNVYKIISRAINERLKPVVNRICSRAQKGYNDKRYVQEVLINVCETMAFCRKENVRGAVLAVDMAKAFDTLDHAFIQEVYKFFGLGNNIIKWLTLLGNNREACIILNAEKNSRYFKLETGRPQGDNLSPFTFNFCEQICIFKLELDTNIEKILRPNPLAYNVPTPFQNESNRETCTNESLADDSTVMTLITQSSLRAIKNCLDEFAVISGLECNYDKTCILPINPISENERRVITESGFALVDNFKLLGANITADPYRLCENFKNVINKIQSQISFWTRFRLSLPGRIIIAKTYMISQINYLGCVFRPNDVQLTCMQELINNFIRKNQKISENRMYAAPECGGIGFFNISDFLDAQMCTWIFRAKKMPIDNWRYDINMLSPGNDPLLLRTTDICKESHPILYDFAAAFERFYFRFSKDSENFALSCIFKNNIFRDPETGNMIEQAFFGQRNYNLHRETIRRLTYADCFSNNNFKSQVQFAENGLNLNVATWVRLRNTVLRAKQENRSIITNPDTATGIKKFVENWKKGSKKIRKYFSDHHEQVNITSFSKFKELVNCDPDFTIPQLGKWLSIWNTHSLSNDFRNFIYMCRYNTLPTNNRLNSYLKDVDPRCSYCRIADAETAQRDSFSHALFECRHVEKLLKKLCTFLGMELYTNNFNLLFWYGIANSQPITNDKHFCLILIFDSFRYLIFKHRRRNHLPSEDDFLDELVFFIKNICRASKKIRKYFEDSILARNLLQARG